MIDAAEVTKLVKSAYISYQRSYVRKVNEDLRKGKRIENTLQKYPFASKILQLGRLVDPYRDELHLSKALDIILESPVYARVDEREQASNEEDKDLEYTDILVKELLKWYKKEFFKWVNKPTCSRCHNDVQEKIIGLPPVKPFTAEHSIGGASIVERYKCLNCQHLILFPRYNNPSTLLDTREGRCGEWNNCFILILKALSIQARYLWNAEDHVWCEYFSPKMKRWIHLDSCENAFDNPYLYNDGWNKKMSYVFAINDHYIVDVSDKYIKHNSPNKLPRNKTSSSSLQRILTVFNSKSFAEIQEDKVFYEAITDFINDVEATKKIGGGATPTAKEEDMKPRQSGAGEWTNDRGENGQ